MGPTAYLRAAAAATALSLFGCQNALSSTPDPTTANPPFYTVQATAGQGGSVNIAVPDNNAVTVNENSPQEAAYELSPSAGASANNSQPVDTSSWAWQAETSHAHN